MDFTDRAITDRTTQVVTITDTIVDAPIRPAGYTGTQRWQPRSITATWERSRMGDGPWGSWGLSGAFVDGQKIKKDGSDGVDSTRERWPEDDPEWAEWIVSSRPADETAPAAQR